MAKANDYGEAKRRNSRSKSRHPGAPAPRSLSARIRIVTARPCSTEILNSRNVHSTVRQRWHLTGASSLNRSGKTTAGEPHA
jgi:hypothetical protein